MEIAVPYLAGSGRLQERKVDASRFRRRGKRVLLKEAAIMYEARRRVGSHSTKQRGEISGTTAKMYRQKGTGHARHGSAKAPQLRGGGVAHAKKPRSYKWKMPARARRAALQAAIRTKLDDGEVRVVQSFGIETPRTKDFVDLLGRLEIDGTFLIVPGEHTDALWRSCRNVPGCAYRTVTDLNAYEVLRQRYLVLDEPALEALEERYGG